MALLDLYNNNTSPLTYFTSPSPGSPTSNLATKLSPLHGYDSDVSTPMAVDGFGNPFVSPGYSIVGTPNVVQMFGQYNTGTNNSVPLPSNLDLQGVTPPKYQDNAPERGIEPRIKDLLGPR